MTAWDALWECGDSDFIGNKDGQLYLVQRDSMFGRFLELWPRFVGSDPDKWMIPYSEPPHSMNNGSWDKDDYVVVKRGEER